MSKWDFRPNINQNQKMFINQKSVYGNESLSWTRNIPDFKPIENCWHYMAKKIRKKRPKSLKEMEKIIEAVWNEKIYDIIFNSCLNLCLNK